MKCSGKFFDQALLIKKGLYSFLILSFFLVNSSLKAQLSGTYTIGGSSPSYSSFTAAISALNTSGVSGPVVFNVRSGTYTERISFGVITGVSQTNTVTFQKEPTALTTPILQYTSTSTSLNYVVRLNGAKHINFKKLHVKAVSGTYSNVFELRGINQYLSIDSCILEAPITTTSSSYRAVINELSGSNNRTSDIDITNNEIIGGSYGIFAYGYSTGIYYHRNWTIEQNNIKDWNNHGVYIQNYFDTVSVAGNVITQKSSSTNTTSYGIQTYRLYNSHIEKNVVELTATNAYGIYLNQQYGYNGARFRFSNNMVSLTNTNPSGTRWGIYAGSCNYADVVHNSIYIANSDVAGSNKCVGIYGTSGSINAYKNNAIEVNSANPLAYGMYFPGSASQSHNCIWMSDQGIPCNKILGTGSILKEPYFNSTTDLHSSSIDMNNAGQALTAVTKDIDGQTRSTTAPDMGADEFTPAAVDAAASEITNFTVCSGSNAMLLRIKNLGTSTLTSLNVGWSVKVNSGSHVSQTPFTYSGSLLSSYDTIVSVGNYSMVSGSTYEFKMWTYSPNNTVDGNNSNDTIYKTYTTSLSGVYTIGGTSPDYTTIQAAATDLKNKGVCGSVNFHIRPGSYNELVTIESAKGLTGSYTATFKKDPNYPGNVYWYRSGRPLTFSSAENIIIRDLVMETKSSTNVIYLTGENKNISVINNTIRGILTSSSSANYACIYNTTLSTGINRNIKIDSNRFSKGSSMAQLRGYNTNVGSRNVGTIITNNTYDSAGYYGMTIQYEDTVTIANNVINDDGVYITQRGIVGTYLYNFDISQNQIYLTKNLYSNTYGFQLSYGGGTTASHSKFSNNYVYGLNCQYGIYIQTVNYCDMYYNTVRLEGSVLTSSYVAYINYGYTYLKNNNFSNEREGRVLFVRSQTYLPLSDNNNFYTNSPTLFAYGSSYRNSFSAWKTAMSRDANSVSIKPEWRSNQGPTPNNSTLNGAASNTTGVSVDLFGNSRSTAPDIGCVEFTPSSNDASITEIYEYSVCPGSTPVKVRLKNAGNNTLTQARIQWNVKTNSGAAVSQTAFTWTGSLPSYADTLISIGNYTFVGSNTYQITAYTDQANNTTDPIKSNDTSISIPAAPSMSGVYTVGGTLPDYSTLPAALTALQSNGICGPVTLNVRGGSHYGQVNFYAIQGVNSVNTITIQTDPSSATRANFNNNGYAFNLSSADYITFKNINIKTNSNSSVVYFSGPTNHIKFVNDSVFGATISNNSSNYAVFRDYTSNAAIQNDLTIDSCVIIDGSYGVYMYGNSSTGNWSQNRIKITNNKFIDFRTIGVYAYYSPELELSGNVLRQRINSGSGYGYQLVYCDSSKILGSDIEMNYGYGISAQNCYGNPNTSGVIIANNFIRLTDSTVIANSNGIRDYSNSYPKVVYNSVVIKDASTNGTCIYGRYSVAATVMNNNFVNYGPGNGQRYLSAGNIAFLDYNNTYTNGDFGQYYGARTSLSAWRTATGKAANSINVNPQFFSKTDLHTLDGSLDGMGSPVVGITTDIDGESRNLTTPDIGADEFTVYTRDAGIYSINSQSICPGTNGVEVTIRNYGLDSLVSTTVQWSVSVNGGTPTTQTPFVFSGLVRTGKDTVLSIGSFTFSKSNTYKIYTNISGVNSSTDLNNSNDTATTPTLFPSMSGLYTVGSLPSDDWSTIDSAVTALENFGVCGPVMIYIKQGNYQESVNIQGIKGTNANNTITFLGDTGTTTKPAWYTSSQPPIILDDVDYLIFKNLNIYTTGYNNTIRFDGDASYLTFEDNTISGRLTTNTSVNYAIIYNPSQGTYQVHHTSFINNSILNGSYGIYWHGNYSGTQYEYGNKILDNTISNSYFRSVYVSFQDSIEISDNYIEPRNSYTNPSGLYVENTATYDITKNNIYLPRGGNGIYLISSSGSVSKYANISNNFIVAAGVYYSYGIYTTNSNYLKIYHNSAHSFSTNSSTNCIYVLSGNNVEVKNNSFFNSGTGPAIRVNNATSYIGDYNNLFSNGNTLGYYSGNRTSLSAWSSITGDDINSVSVNPNYKDSFDLHSTNSTMNNAGTPLGILDDIDGDLRSATAPDIGADEYTAVPRDLNLKTLSDNFCEGTQSITLDLTNSGTLPVTTGKISWSVSVNGATPVAQTPVITSGSLASLKDTTVTLGNLVFNSGDYYSILVYVDSVNGNLDQNFLNDTLRIDSLYATMTGTYTVGGTSPDFTTMSEATSALYTRGVCGKVFINVRPGIYTDRIYLPNAIDGADTANTITFQTDTAFGGRAELNNNNFVAFLNEADHIRIKNLKLNHTGSVAAFKATNVNNVVLDSNDFIGIVANNNIAAQSVIHFNGGSIVSSGITITNNTITNGSRGINIQYGVAPTDIKIGNNTINNYREYGMFVSRADDIEIDHNTIKNNQLVAARTHGIYGELITNYSIHANKIDVDGLNYTVGARGIYIVSSYGSSTMWSYVYNNFVACAGSGGVSGVGDGISLTNCSYVQIDHNSVNQTITYATSNAFKATGCSNYYVRNNSFVNAGQGYAISVSTIPTVSNNNNLYSSGGAVGFYSVARTTLSNWRSVTGRDQQSVSVNPFYYSATDLHTSSFSLNSVGQNLSYISEDIDGDSRGGTRDIGADEFTPLQRDASITDIKELFCAGVTPIKVTIQNFGTQNITSAKIKWWLSTNGSLFIPQPDFTFSGNIVSGNSITSTIASHNFQDGITYSYMAVVDEVNGATDLNAVNDTALRTSFKPAMNGSYSIGLNSDFNSMSEADSALDIAGVCGPVVLNLQQGTFNESVTMGNYEGISSLNNITIQADTNNTAGVYWTDSISPLRLVDAEHITVKGLNLTSTNSGSALYINGKANKIEFINNVFTGITTSSTDLAYSTVFYHRTSTDTLSNVSFIGNEMYKGSYGVYIYGTSANRFSSVEFKDNYMTDYRYNGLQLGYVDSLNVEGNEFKNSTNGYGTTAITVLYSNQLSIQNNKVDHTGLGGRTALYVGWSNGTSSSRNIIANN
ncbi:MAG: right-handed parallel beta-helix repeat-containing protein, partial [Salibacteraceae bacterium]